MKSIKLLVLDIDGTMTDGKIYIGEQGELMKAFDIKDGYAIYKLLPEHGIKPVVITGRSSKIVENRCLELGVSELHQGCLDKGEKLKEIASSIPGKMMSCMNLDAKEALLLYDLLYKVIGSSHCLDDQ